MAQFGLHALLGLWIVWGLPTFSPYIMRISFGAGIFLGCVLPDMDIYAEGIAYLIDESFAPKTHRTLMHSLITAFVLMLVCMLLERVVHKKQRQLYDIEATLDDTFMILGGDSQSRTPGINFSAFGIGLFAGMVMHIVLDIVFWFSAIDILFPLSRFDIVQPIDAWAYKPPQIAVSILALSETFFFAFYFTILRGSVAKKLGKWTDSFPDELRKRRQSFTDNDIEHLSVDYSLHTQDDICPLDQKTLSQARPALTVSKGLIIFQYLYFVVLGVVFKFASEKVFYELVYAEVMIVCIPAYCYLGWALRDVIMRKTDV